MFQEIAFYIVFLIDLAGLLARKRDFEQQSCSLPLGASWALPGAPRAPPGRPPGAPRALLGAPQALPGEPRVPPGTPPAGARVKIYQKTPDQPPQRPICFEGVSLTTVILAPGACV